MRFSLKRLLVVITSLAVILSAVLLIRAAWNPRAVVNIDHPNGTKLLVTQEYGVASEPFVTEIFFDDGDGNWRWYYFDHEDEYWGSVNTQIEGNRIRVSSEHRKILFDTKTGECTITNSQGKTWTSYKSESIGRIPPTINREDKRNYRQ